MKGTIQSSAILLPLALSLVAANNNPLWARAVAAPPPNNNSPPSGNNNPPSGNNASPSAKNNASPPAKNNAPPKVQGGNQVQTTYEFKNDQFGNGDVLNLGSQTAIQGGGTKGRRSVDELDLYIRDLEQQILYGRAAYAYPDGNGGKSSGGDSRAGGGNSVTNKNNMNGASIGAGSQVSMGNQNKQSGGNVQGGSGGANAGIGGSGGFGPSFMPMSFSRRGFFDDDGEFSDDLNIGSSFVHKGPNEFSFSHSTVQQGGDVKGQDGKANVADGADASSLSFSRRWLEVREADGNGGAANGGGSNSNGGNQVTNKNNMNGATIGAGAKVGMSNQNMQKGGNVFGGDGGQNNGRGGSAGGFPPMMGSPFAPMRRDVDFLYARDNNGGASGGGDSKARGGNKVNNKNSMNGVNAGAGAQISMGNQNSQQGGNTMGGSGGANAGIGGGANGALPGMGPMPFPPMMSKRDAEIEDILARAADADLDDIYFELVAREAFPDPEAEAEPEEFDIYERDVFFFDSEYGY